MFLEQLIIVRNSTSHLEPSTKTLLASRNSLFHVSKSKRVTSEPQFSFKRNHICSYNGVFQYYRILASELKYFLLPAPRHNQDGRPWPYHAGDTVQHHERKPGRQNPTLITTRKGQANAVLCMRITQRVKRWFSSARHILKNAFFAMYPSKY
jgi:hypothetical protein